MKRILLACSAGMSTSMLVQKMQKAAETQGIEAKIEAHAIAEIAVLYKEYDVIMLGPQVKFALADIKKTIGGAIPVEVIAMTDYGRVNGEGVLKRALELIG